MVEVTTIVLAAGLSRRMEAANKLLLPIAGQPMIAHVAQVYLDATHGPVCVVTGHEAENVTAALADTDVATVFNPEYALGQATSVACGLRHAGASDLLLIGLGDQPALRPSDITALLDAHRAGDPDKISIPMHGEARGNPIVVPASLRPRLLADPRAPGCKRFTRDHPEHVQRHDLPARGFYTDIDTPDAYAAFAKTEDA